MEHGLEHVAVMAGTRRVTRGHVARLPRTVNISIRESNGSHQSVPAVAAVIIVREFELTFAALGREPAIIVCVILRPQERVLTLLYDKTFG